MAKDCAMLLDEEMWETLADVYAFAGNSLLAPMSQTSAAGLDAAFWASFPTFDDAGVAEALGGLRGFAEGVQAGEAAGGDSAQAVSVEYARLFVGPPKPACPPWETYWRSSGATCGFGAATFEMREVLRRLGLQVSGPSNQFEDHVGIELLALSEMCRRAVGKTEGISKEGSCATEADVAAYLDQHLGAWLHGFAQAVAEKCPGGYYALLLDYAAKLISWHRGVLG